MKITGFCFKHWLVKEDGNECQHCWVEAEEAAIKSESKGGKNEASS